MAKYCKSLCLLLMITIPGLRCVTITQRGNLIMQEKLKRQLAQAKQALLGNENEELFPFLSGHNGMPECGFENGNCSYIGFETGGYKWKRQSTRNPRTSSMPNREITYNNPAKGHYMQVDLQDMTEDYSLALMAHPAFVTTRRSQTTYCLTFWVQGFGVDDGNFSIYLLDKDLDTDDIKPTYTFLGADHSLGNFKSLYTQFSVSGANKKFSFSFAVYQAKRRDGAWAVDEIKLREGTCYAQWRDWYEWGSCSGSCSRATQSRNRVCEGGPGTCGGTTRGTQSCTKPGCPSPPGCRQPAITPIFSRILGGQPVTPHSWPWQVRLLRSDRNDYLCGGVIINSRHILTAAHCVVLPNENKSVTKERVEVITGDHDSWRADRNEKVYDIESIKDHEDYYRGRHDKRHDIAVIRTKTPIAFNDHVQAACLPTTSAPIKKCVTTGWGQTGSVGFQGSRFLRQVTIETMEQSVCRQSVNHGNKIYDEMICAAHPSGGRDACKGDSGGPLVCKDTSSDRWILYGLTSWGSEVNCGEIGKPGVYQRVYYHIDWIRNNTRI